jgi:hypothetical protein
MMSVTLFTGSLLVKIFVVVWRAMHVLVARRSLLTSLSLLLCLVFVCLHLSVVVVVFFVFFVIVIISYALLFRSLTLVVQSNIGLFMHAAVEVVRAARAVCEPEILR